ncbi:MAG: beta-carotene 15,15'-dioxygenase, Brp/Blh family [Flavobacteriaceae bacterium]|nr:beta-carotene 15,15'-dioxygenase, Brp/Blh family [Flavobacteriaceae bacterium]
MIYFKQIQLIGSVFLLWITTQANAAFENLIGLSLILSLGILHGSNDLKLITNKSKQYFNYLHLLIYYVIGIMITFVMSLKFPVVCVLLFIVISSYHFGEQHFANKIKNNFKGKWLFYCSYGLLIFSSIFIAHKDAVIGIFTGAIGDFYWDQMITSLFFISLAVSILFFFTLRHKEFLRINIIIEMFTLLVLIVIFYNATLILSFTIYFVVWHAIPAIKDQLILLHHNITKKSILLYLKSSLPFWLISFAGGIGVLYFNRIILNENPLLFLALIFSFTLPHIIIIGLISKK